MLAAFTAVLAVALVVTSWHVSQLASDIRNLTEAQQLTTKSIDALMERDSILSARIDGLHTDINVLATLRGRLSSDRLDLTYIRDAVTEAIELIGAGRVK